jgi:RNA polymerase sigma factor (sigma-70 family)
VEIEAFERCWHENVRRVAAYAERHVGRDASYDVVSNTFLTAWRKWNEVPTSALPWLIATARGHIRNELRTQRRQQGLEARIRLLDQSAYAGPEVGAGAHNRADALAALAALPEQDREALLLVAWEGLTDAEAAMVLRCRPATFRVRLHRARKRLAGTAISTEQLSRTALRGIQ